MIYYVPLCFHCSFGSFIPIFCLYSHNSVNFVTGISSMRLMKVVYKFHLKCLQKVFRKFLFWCLGWFPLKSLEVLYITHFSLFFFIYKKNGEYISKGIPFCNGNIEVCGCIIKYFQGKFQACFEPPICETFRSWMGGGGASCLFLSFRAKFGRIKKKKKKKKNLHDHFENYYKPERVYPYCVWLFQVMITCLKGMINIPILRHNRVVMTFRKG